VQPANLEENQHVKLFFFMLQHQCDNGFRVFLFKLLPFCIEGESSEEEEETSYGSFMIERLTGSKSGRIDHMLQVRSCSN